MVKPARLPLSHPFLALSLGLSLSVGACAAGDSLAAFPNNQQPQWGGQTGSLTCGDFRVPTAGHSLGADGSAQFLLRAGRCETELPDLSAVLILDSQNEPVAYEVEVVEADTLRLRSTETRPAGTYTLILPNKPAATVDVLAKTQAPSQLGEVAWLGPACEPTFELFPAAELLPHASRLRIDISVDDGPLQTWFATDELRLQGGGTDIALRQCSPVCLSDGMHQLRIVGSLAGAERPLDPVRVDVEVTCTPPSQSCSGGPTGHPPWGLCLAAAVYWRRRRQRAAP